MHKFLNDLPGASVTHVMVPTALEVCNPSITGRANGFSVLVRALDPVPYVGPALPFVSSESWLLDYTETLAVRSALKLDDREVRQKCPEAVHGLEDGRLFEWQGQLWILYSGLRREISGYHNTMLICRVEGSRLTDPRVLPSPKHLKREKNWMPWVMEEALYLVYSTQPLEIYRVSTAGLEPVSVGSTTRDPVIFPVGGAMMSGSSQVIPWGKGRYLAVTHHRRKAAILKKLYMKHLSRDPAYQRKKVVFHHYLMMFDESFTLLGCSRPFQFETEGVEFCAGIVKRDDQVVLSYGVMDNQARMLTMDVTQLERTLFRQGFHST